MDPIYVTGLFDDVLGYFLLYVLLYMYSVTHMYSREL
jgi:hypothetical protein